MHDNFYHKVKVYYEDTDAGGVVYYANYLKFLERARTEMINSFGLSNNKLLSNHKTAIIVKSCDIKYIKTAKLEDKIKIHSSILSIKRASFFMIQNIKKENQLILTSKIQLVTVDLLGKPKKIPAELQKQLNKF